MSCLLKRLGTAWPFLSCIPVFYVTRGRGVALLELLFTTSFSFPSKLFPDAAGSRADSHKLQKPLETGGGFLTEPAWHRAAARPLPGEACGEPRVGCSGSPGPPPACPVGPGWSRSRLEVALPAGVAGGAAGPHGAVLPAERCAGRLCPLPTFPSTAAASSPAPPHRAPRRHLPPPRTAGARLPGRWAARKKHRGSGAP